jgi:hypothetical protein
MVVAGVGRLGVLGSRVLWLGLWVDGFVGFDGKKIVK